MRWLYLISTKKSRLSLWHFVFGQCTLQYFIVFAPKIKIKKTKILGNQLENLQLHRMDISQTRQFLPLGIIISSCEIPELSVQRTVSIDSKWWKRTRQRKRHIISPFHLPLFSTFRIFVLLLTKRKCYGVKTCLSRHYQLFAIDKNAVHHKTPFVENVLLSAFRAPSQQQQINKEISLFFFFFNFFCRLQRIFCRSL